MALRAFRATVLVAIDDAEAIENEQREPDAGPVTLDELKDYVTDAVGVSLNDEDHGNPVGVQSVELSWESLTELSDAERTEVYGK